MRKRRRPRPQPDRALTLVPITRDCPECQHRLHADYNNFRTITTLDGVIRLTLTIRRCPHPDCPRFLRPYRPEAEPHFALPYHEFGLDVMATVGRFRYAEHRSIPEIHRELTRRGIVVAVRTVTNLLDRYDELRALASADPKRLEPLLRDQRRVREPSLRHYVRAKELKAAGMDWTDVLAEEVENRRARLAAELLASTAYDSTAARVKVFVQKGGGCRATFFNYRRYLLK